MYTPTATYRVQLQKDFNFKKLQGIIEYLYDLGVSTIYASPITTAVKGSTHGYDNLNPLEVNPEIGTISDWEGIRMELEKYAMGWLQDIVPNHMAYAIENKWIADVYAKGKQSEFYSFFDIIPQTADTEKEEKIMIPFLGKELSACIRDRELSLIANESGFFLKYFDQSYPISLESKSWIESLSVLSLSNKKTEQLSDTISRINETPELLGELADKQHYELTDSKLSQTKMNYRRFFAVNALICLRIQDETVYNCWHPLLLSLYQHGFIQGFRLDHIDGLFDPAGYLGRLRRDAGHEAYIVSEKILHEEEETIDSWPVQGTTGYDFLAYANQLFTDHEGKNKLLEFYHSAISSATYDDIVFEKKYAFLKKEMNGELENLMRWMMPCLSDDEQQMDRAELTEALALFLCAFPVYRAYAEELPLTAKDKQYTDQAFRLVASKFPEFRKAFQVIQEIFETTADDKINDEVLLFIRRWSQYTAPLAAKGIEDTTFYNYHVLISHNEVGDSPNSKPVTASVFHQRMKTRCATANFSMNAGSTHDTKRGEDNRLRINLISLYADEWIGLMEKFRIDNSDFIKFKNQVRTPSVNAEYLIYQALVGAISFDLIITENFLSRVRSYLQKALREEKQDTTWAEPNTEYENGCVEFVKEILNSAKFRSDFFPFLQKILDRAYGFILSQTLIRLTAPGIPDIYQGSELWDLSFVDPDNRLPVDFSLRKELMDQLIKHETVSHQSAIDFANAKKTLGAQKLLLIRKVLSFRRDNPEIFNEGNYVPAIDSRNMIAYTRKTGRSEILVIAPLPSGDTQIHFPCKPEISGLWTNLITGKLTKIGSDIDTGALLQEFPVALLMRKA